MNMQNPFELLSSQLSRMENMIGELNEKVNSIKNNSHPTIDSISRPEAAKYLGISEKTLINLENSGQITPIRIGRSVRYDYSILDEFKESRHKKTRSTPS